FGKVNLTGLYDKLGIDKEIATRGAHAGMYSPHQSFSDDEREILRRQMEMFYDNFINVVAEGRGVSAEQIEDVAQGRVWTGTAAKENGLIDEFGGLPRAIASAAQLAGIENKHYTVQVLPRAKGFSLPQLRLPLWLIGYQTDDWLADLSALNDERLWYMLPWQWEIE
ncbi:S49 family peptidase, partial [Candidatus Zixiibacteriota bacterium]